MPAENLIIHSDSLSNIIKTACEAAIKELLHLSDIFPRRLLNIEEAAAYLSLSEREIHNMVTSKSLVSVRHGRRLMLDLRDLEQWISAHKVSPSEKDSATHNTR